MTRSTLRRAAWMVALMVALSAASTLAQPRKGAGPGMPRYDPSAEVTLKGTVDEVQPHQARSGGTGTHLAFKTESGVMDVHVGPTNWLSEKKYEFAKGDQLEIVGSKVTVDGKDAFLAREIRKGGVTMTLRDASGKPVWSGGPKP